MYTTGAHFLECNEGSPAAAGTADMHIHMGDCMPKESQKDAIGQAKKSPQPKKEEPLLPDGGVCNLAKPRRIDPMDCCGMNTIFRRDR